MKESRIAAGFGAIRRASYLESRCSIVTVVMLEMVLVLEAVLKCGSSSVKEVNSSVIFYV